MPNWNMRKSATLQFCAAYVMEVTDAKLQTRSHWKMEGWAGLPISVVMFLRDGIKNEQQFFGPMVAKVRRHIATNKP